MSGCKSYYGAHDFCAHKPEAHNPSLSTSHSKENFILPRYIVTLVTGTAQSQAVAVYAVPNGYYMNNRYMYVKIVPWWVLWMVYRQFIQCRAQLVLVWVTVLESCCQPCVEVLSKSFISCCLWPPSSDGYLVERKVEDCEWH